ncbi:uncharacterized protein LOC122146628 isoform X14 [Cyprinus carpio]|uniref:Uncharacterized protein LOC122146628 isoform X14 n=1 Tax=Cyprinus carpio TaxID=7962 RepID=A0A9R0B4X3_CYPCA|nr:uncharacterized protein LOC122146628 isoform X14 [Cyprinus carpio]XP_042622675.1 uncharacterized protein LOC122146628 isoform X14 [Cyprinus carpio]XP_042622676.1 uncharacterized protein LOC122146628 isoform X14 [Cyprinus carpio]
METSHTSIKSHSSDSAASAVIVRNPRLIIDTSRSSKPEPRFQGGSTCKVARMLWRVPGLGNITLRHVCGLRVSLPLSVQREEIRALSQPQQREKVQIFLSSSFSLWFSQTLQVQIRLGSQEQSVSLSEPCSE